MKYISYPIDPIKLEEILREERQKSWSTLMKGDFITDKYGITSATFNNIKKAKAVKFHTRAKLESKGFPIDKVLV